MEIYTASLMHIIHNEKTADSVIKMLQSGPPEQSIPSTAYQINKQVEQSFTKKTGKVDDSVKIAGALYLASDLSELGNVAGIWDTAVTQDSFPKSIFIKGLDPDLLILLNFKKIQNLCLMKNKKL